MVKKLLILCFGFGLAMGIVACQDKKDAGDTTVIEQESATSPATTPSSDEDVTVESITVTPDNTKDNTTAPADSSNSDQTNTNVTNNPPASDTDNTSNTNNQ